MTLSVTSRCSVEIDGQIKLVFGIWHVGFFQPILLC